MSRPATRYVLAVALICIRSLAVCAPQRAEASELCGQCDLTLGVGTTFSTWAWTGGVVFPVTLELQDGRWELGAFRFATGQRANAGALPANTNAANPYWGFSAMKRWQLLHRGLGRLYFGFGANYRTEVDFLESTKWNFAYVLAVRFDVDARGHALELGVRHWSDAWIRPPNRGQNFVTLSFVF
jgi:lipid A 3-O-deacylase PagL